MKSDEISANFLSTPSKILSTIEQSAEWCKEWSFAVASAHAEGGCAKMWNAIEPNLAKLKYAIVGLESPSDGPWAPYILHEREVLRITEPWILRELHEIGALRIVDAKIKDFNPRLYIFQKGEALHIIVGSAEFSARAFTTSEECAVKIEAALGHPFAVSAIAYMNKCLGHARMMTSSEITSYSQIYIGMRSDNQDVEAYNEFTNDDELVDILETQSLEQSEATNCSEEQSDEFLDENLDDTKGNSAERQRTRSPEEISQEEILVTIRQIFSRYDKGKGIEREEALRMIASELGYARLGYRARGRIEKEMVAASRRNIVRGERGIVFAETKTIDDYSRDDLKRFLLAVMARKWWQQDKAIKAVSSYLGFRKMTESINNSFRSAINGLLRQNLLERDGENLRERR